MQFFYGHYKCLKPCNTWIEGKYEKNILEWFCVEMHWVVEIGVLVFDSSSGGEVEMYNPAYDWQPAPFSSPGSAPPRCLLQHSSTATQKTILNSREH